MRVHLKDIGDNLVGGIIKRYFEMVCGEEGEEGYTGLPESVLLAGKIVAFKLLPAGLVPATVLDQGEEAVRAYRSLRGSYRIQWEAEAAAEGKAESKAEERQEEWFSVIDVVPWLSLTPELAARMGYQLGEQEPLDGDEYVVEVDSDDEGAVEIPDAEAYVAATD